MRIWNWLFLGAFLSTVALAAPRVEHIDPGRLGKNFINDIQTFPHQSDVARSLEPLEETPIDEQITTFVLKKIKLVGARQLPLNDIHQIYRPYLGKEITLHHLRKIATGITNLYRTRGFLISQAMVPPQHIKDGVVTIQIVEGYISRVLIDGSMPRSTRWLVEQYGRGITAQRPVHRDILERYLLLSDDIPGLDIESVLKPSPTHPGASELILIPKVDRFDGFISFDNEISARYGAQQVTAQAVINQLLPGSRTSLTARSSIEVDKMNIFNIIHSQYIGSDGLKLTLLAQYVKNAPKIINGMAPFDIAGHSHMYHANLAYSLIRLRNFNWGIDFQFDLQNITSNIKLLGATQREIKDRVRSLRLGTNLEVADDFLGTNLMSFEISQGLDVLDASNANSSRAEGCLTYTKLNAEYSRLQMLTNRWSALLTLQGQYAFNQLLSPEEFGVGGSAIGRGYDSSEITGDDGLASKLELRYNLLTGSRIFTQVQLFGFFDSGVVWNKNNIGQNFSDYILSTGLGARTNIDEFFTLNVHVSQPINRNVAAKGNRDPRVFFVLAGHV